ncbi:MAG TPA: TM2 domain-containing protein [Terrimesophilobacter sp.]|nr:TM2 domain-containing protein [Terrimesophilobacter sp.]HRQ00209.1 TM2 domain-containing protein [Terrimesophilobacter sp.]
MTETATPPTNPYAPAPTEKPQKSFIVTWLLSLLVGVFGVDRFYLGKVGTGILKLITFGGLGIWWLIDLIMTLAGAQKDKAGRPLADHDRHKKMAWIVTAVVVVLSLVWGGTNAANRPSVPAASPQTPAAPVAPVTPTKSDEPTQEPAEAGITNGDHIVGSGIEPGQYRAEVEPAFIELCTVSQSRDSDVIDINNAAEGSVIFTVQDLPGTVVSFSGCENIGLAADMLRSNPSTITNGDWLVGGELAPGQYQGTVDQESAIAYGAITQTGTNGDIIDIRNANEGSVIFTVQDFSGSVVSFQGLVNIKKVG